MTEILVYGVRALVKYKIVELKGTEVVSFVVDQPLYNSGKRMKRIRGHRLLSQHNKNQLATQTHCPGSNQLFSLVHLSCVPTEYTSAREGALIERS